jgi:hypothetical protein
VPADWSIDEVRSAVAAYFDLLERELRGETPNKSAARRELNAVLSGRSEGSIERKHQNISAILIGLGLPYIDGYKPLFNYQRLLADLVLQRLPTATSLLDAVRSRTDAPLAGVSLPGTIFFKDFGPRRRLRVNRGR